MSKVVKDIIYNVDVKTNNADKNLKNVAASGNAVTSSFKNMVTGIGAVTAAFKAFEFVKNSVFEADRIRQAQAVYKNFFKYSLDTYEEAIAKMRKATGNAVDDYTLLMNAIKTKQFGLQTDSIKLMELARKTAYITGRSTADVYNDIVTAAARQSMMIADNMNVTIRMKEAYIAYARELKKSVEDLTDAEKKRAFEFLFIKKLQANVAKSGIKNFDTLAEKSAELSIEIKKLGVALLQVITPQVRKAFTWLAKKVKQVTNLVNRFLKAPKRITVYEQMTENLKEYKKELADATKKLERQKNFFGKFNTKEELKHNIFILETEQKIASLKKKIATYERNADKIKEKDIRRKAKEKEMLKAEIARKKAEEKRIEDAKRAEEAELSWIKEKKKLEIDLIQDKYQKDMALLEMSRQEEIKKYGLTEKIKLEINKLYNEKKAQLEAKYNEEKTKKELAELKKQEEFKKKLAEENMKLEDGLIEDQDEAEIRRLERERDKEIKQWMQVEGMKAKISQYYDTKINRIKKQKADEFNEYIKQENIALIEDDKKRQLAYMEDEEKKLIEKYAKVEGAKEKIQALYAKKRASLLQQDAEKNPYMLEVEQLEKSVIEMEKLYHRKQVMLETTGNVADALFEKAKKGESLHWKEMNRIVAQGIQNELAAYGKKEAVLAVVYALTGQFAKAAKATAASIAAYAGVKALAHMAGGSPSSDNSTGSRGSGRSEDIFGKEEEKPIQTNIYIQGSFIDNYDKLAQKITELQNKNNRRRDIKIVNSR